VIVPQGTLGEDTAVLRRTAPRAWRYLSKHRALLDARKSSIYAGQPPFAIFGVGPYSFAPWKVAVSGLYKRAAFTLVGPHEGRPVVLDDTCYFLSFDDERSARRAAAALGSALARDFFAARIFWDAKRPITKSILQTLDLAALQRALPHVAASGSSVSGFAPQSVATSAAATRAAVAQKRIAAWKSWCFSSQPVMMSPPKAPK
jgi:hypothetical protein